MTNIAFSFDDGRKDNYIVAKKILEPLNMPASFNITIGYVENKLKDVDKPSLNEPMSMEELREIHNAKIFEIADHGYKHNNDVYNLIKGAKEIKEKLEIIEDKKIGIASPHSQFNLNEIKKIENAEDDNGNKLFSYLRISHNFEKNEFIRRVIRKINRKIHFPFFYYWVYKYTYFKDNNFLIYSVPVVKDNKLKEVKYLINKAVKEDKSYILMFHSILKKDEKYYNDLYSWDYNDFKKLCEFLKSLESEKKLKVKTVEEMVKEGKNE